MNKQNIADIQRKKVTDDLSWTKLCLGEDKGGDEEGPEKPLFSRLSCCPK